jgi:hypothetical protein
LRASQAAIDRDRCLPTVCSVGHDDEHIKIAAGVSRAAGGGAKQYNLLRVHSINDSSDEFCGLLGRNHRNF